MGCLSFLVPTYSWIIVGRGISTFEQFAPSMVALGIRNFASKESTNMQSQIFRQGNTLQNSLFVSKSGSDSSGARNREDLPYLTLSAAKAAAVSGDTIIVEAGTYSENNLLKNGVNWHFMPGAIVSYVDADAINGYGIFDDRATGACVCRITGGGTFVYQIDFNALCRGLLYTQDPASDIYFEALRLSITDTTGASSFAGGIAVKNCLRVVARVGNIFDQNYGAGTSYSSGIYWEKGECHVHVSGKIAMDDGYCIWAKEPGVATTTGLWVTAHQLDQFVCSPGFGAIEVDAVTDAYRVWIDVKEVTALSGPAYKQTGGGRVYLRAMKINNTGGSCVQMTAGKLWLTTQKISSDTRWLDIAGATTEFDGHVMHLEDTSSSGVKNDWLKFTNGTTTLSSGRAKIRQGSCILHTAGTARIKGLTIDTTTTNAAGSNPAVLAGNGLILESCLLVAPALADSITGAFTVKSWNTLTNKAKNAGTTVQGTLTVDANVT
jgi:hypothetical protein